MISLLCVDDDPSLLELVKIFLERMGQFNVTTATGANGAFEALKTGHFDAIISDYQMPGMDGITFLKTVRDRCGDIPFILFTGRGREEVVIEAINNGADFYLQKGGDPESQFAELIHKVRQAVVQHRAQDELGVAYERLAESDVKLQSQLRDLERMQSERLETEENFRNLVENAPVAIYIQTKGRFVYLNNAAVRLLGASSADELLGKEFIERVHPSFHDLIRKRVSTLTIDLEPVELLEETYLTLDGTPIDVEVKAVPFKFGEDHGVLVMLHDITVRKRAEEELRAAYEQITATDMELRRHYEELAQKELLVRESEARFRAIIEQSVQFIGLMTIDGILIKANRASLEFTGIPESDILGRPFWDTPWWAHSEELREKLKDAVKSAAAGNTIKFEATNIGADGQITYIDFSLKPVVDEEGRISYLIPEGRDITWLKQAEEALRQSEERYRIFVETANEGIWAIDAKFDTTFVNKKMQEIFGYTAQEMMGRPVWDFVPPGDAESMKEVLRERRTGVPGRYERRWIKKDGSLVWCLTSATALFSPDGTFTGSFGLFTDITERVRMDEALCESEKKYATVVEQSQDGIFIAQDGKLVFHNRAFSAITGYADEELEGRSIADLIAPEDRELVLTRHQERLEGKTPPEIYEFSALHRDGKSRIPVKMSIAAGTFQGMPATIGTLHNMTEERKKERILRESEERYRTIIENIHEGFVRMDSEGIILMVNRSAIDLFGCESSEELVGIPIVSFYRDPVERKNLIDRMGTEGRVDGFETEFKKKDGSAFWGSVDAHYYSNPTGEPAGTEALFRDITDRKTMERALHDANRKLALLTSVTRHDVANQLTILRGSADMASGEVRGTPAAGHLARIDAAAVAISRLLEYTRTYQELGGHAPAWFRIDETVAKTAVRQVSIHEACGRFEIFADPMIERVFFNLFENAQRHGGNVTEISVRCRESADWLVIVVEDNGVGIPAHEKEKIFERGFGKNTGFGLFLAREILSITGMTITETGKEGKGARFEILVPRMFFRNIVPGGRK